jgi:hypothetical protein
LVGNFDYRASTPITIPANVSTVVASIAPAVNGHYIVNGAATGQKFSAGGFLACRLLVESLRASTLLSPTPYGYNNVGSTYGTLATGGAVVASTSTPIQLRCLTNVAGGASVINAAVDDVLVASVNGVHAAPAQRTPANKFVIPKPVPGGAQSILGVKAKPAR